MNHRNKKEPNKPTLQEKIVGRTTNIVHLTHNDLDAAGSDAICRMTFGDEILTLFSSVGRFNWFVSQIAGCNGKGDTLIISDLGYQNGVEDQIRKAHAAGWKIQWYDHHKWTDAEKQKTAPFVETLIIDTNKCATGVIASVFAKDNKPALEIARVVCDYDLWKHQDPRSGQLGIVTSKQENLRLVRDKLRDGIIIDEEIMQIFKRIEKDKNRCMKKSIRSAKIFRGKYTIAVMPSYGYPSETAAEARKKLGTDIEVLVFDNGKFSLRSVPDISHLIAKQFNGGGHPNASGGSFNYTCWERWKLKLFRKVSRAEKFVSVAEKL